MQWETKKFVGLSLLQYLLYCDGLELNLQCPRSACTTWVISSTSSEAWVGVVLPAL